jgi:membrane fusion protein (multidrug efflux system)
VSAAPHIFRAEALAHAAGARAQDADVLRVAPHWTRAAYPLLMLVAIASVLFLVFASVHEYASGPAVVWVKGRVDLTATSPATVRDVEARPGERVARGAVLVRFHAAREEADLARVTRELESQLGRLLRDPTDDIARYAVATLTSERDLARAHLDELTLRAPRDGIVGDVRVREGERLAAGDLVLTLWDSDAPRTVIAMLPGHYQPQLHPGASMRFELSGYRHAYQELTIERVGGQVVGPGEARRYLGAAIADAVTVEGPVVLVEATVPGGEIQVDGNTLPLRHGMTGTAEARVRKESLLFALVPGLRGALGAW